LEDKTVTEDKRHYAFCVNGKTRIIRPVGDDLTRTQRQLVPALLEHMEEILDDRPYDEMTKDERDLYMDSYSVLKGFADEVYMDTLLDATADPPQLLHKALQWYVEYSYNTIEDMNTNVMSNEKGFLLTDLWPEISERTWESGTVSRKALDLLKDQVTLNLGAVFEDLRLVGITVNDIKVGREKFEEDEIQAAQRIHAFMWVVCVKLQNNDHVLLSVTKGDNDEQPDS
jgi:hypothetical protein